MTYQVKVVLLGIIAVIGFDFLASFASRTFGFPYAAASIGSYCLYFAIGFAAARGAASSAIQNAAAAGAFAGLADASIGWAVSWVVGPGRLPAGERLTVTAWLVTAILVTFLAASIAALGGLLGRRQPTAGARAA